MFKLRKTSHEKNLEKEREKELLKESVNQLIPDELFPVTTHLQWSDDSLSVILDLKYSEMRKVNLKQLIKKKKEFVEEQKTEKQGKRSLFQKQTTVKIPYNVTVIESEIKSKMVDSNKLRFKIEVVNKTNISKIVSGGNYDFGDDFPKGYSLTVSQTNRENVLMNWVTKILRDEGWACIYGEITTHCHLKKEFPTIDEAKILLQNLILKINKSLSEDGMPISMMKYRE